MSKTQLKKLLIERFRALRDVEVELGDHITVVCGKNGTSKSSVLGIAAQIFSFEKDYVSDTTLSFQQIAGGSFKSLYSDHFRMSEKYDVPGSMTVNIELHDGYTNGAATAKLGLARRQNKPRPVVRNNSTASGNKSRNFTHPVIFLSLKRLFPIAAREYNVGSFDYLNRHVQDFLNLTNEILNKNSPHAIGTDGTISSAVAHGTDYDQESVSAGEDNAGQIALAIMSFRKLKEEYADYKGGLLLIDEADAGLFPTAQVNLWKVLARACAELNLQVIMTSHSPVLIEHAYEQSRSYRRRYKTIYFSDTYGDVQIMQDWSWGQINADITTRTIRAESGVSLPSVRIYFEDKEAADFFAALLYRQPIRKFTAPLPGITLGCSNYIQLINNRIPEFAQNSVVCLDGDQPPMTSKTVVLLPGPLPPDRLIFQYLYNLAADDPFWRNDLQFTRDVFTNIARDVTNEFGITGNTVDVEERVAAYNGNKKPRDVFKKFYQDEQFQQIISSGATKPYNPWAHWTQANPEETNDFLTRLKVAMHGVMRNGYGVDEAKLQTLEVKPRKIG